MNKKISSLFMAIILFSSAVFDCYANEEINSSVQTEVFVWQELFRQYSMVYDTFSAAIVLDDGTEITGIGFTDYSTYYESDDGSGGFFPAGFIADYGYIIPKEEVNNGLIIENLDYTDEKYQFVYDYDVAPFKEHCVKDGQYLKYGVNEYGAISYETSKFERGKCDESLGALFSYDTGKIVFDPDFGNYTNINGCTLFDQIDFTSVEAYINQIIADQNANFSHQEIVTSVYIAHEAVVSYLLSLQQETFLGYKVSDLINAASLIDPLQCIRITPEGIVIIDIDDTPATADELTKWLVGTGCLILVAGSIALEIFVPAAHPLSGVVMGAAIDVFLQVVIENNSLDNIQWEKVAIAAASGAMMAWICPMAASEFTHSVINAGASKALGKLAGYGILTISNSIVTGSTNLAFSVMDGKEDKLNAFLMGAAIGAAGTVMSSLLTETISVSSHKVTQVLSRTKTGMWFNKSAGKADLFIRNHQVHKCNNLEKILSPKTVHQAAENAWREVNYQSGIIGGEYSSLTNPGDGSLQRHETPSFGSYNSANGITDGKRGNLPAIQMETLDHRMTASFGTSYDAIAYRNKQIQYISEGNMHAAIQMDIDDITSKFGTKYNNAIQQMLDYAKKMGWW